MLTESATRARDWLLFAAAALAPAIAIGGLGLRALSNEASGARREAAAALDAAAERAAAQIERDVASGARALGAAALPARRDDHDSKKLDAARIDALVAAARAATPATAEPFVLDAAGAVIFPAAAGASSAPPGCAEAAATLASSRDPALREAARATLLASCEEAQRDGRWLFPVVALDAVRRGGAGAAVGERLVTWFGAHAGALGDAERDASLKDVEALPAPLRDACAAALAGRSSRRDELAAVLRQVDVAGALRAASAVPGRAAEERRRAEDHVAALTSPRAIGAARAVDEDATIGFVIHGRTLGDAARAGAFATPAVAVDVFVGAPPPARARAAAAPLVARAQIAPELALRFSPADPRAAARHAQRGRALLGGVALATTALAFALASLLFARMRAARRSSALRTDFVSAVSHELRTPIASVRMLAELLEEDRVEEGERAEVVGGIAREARRLGETVDRLLGFSRMEAGRFALDRRRARVAEAVEASLATFAERHPELAVERAIDDAIEADVDVAQLAMAVDNLLANAAKYAPDGAPYRVSVAAAGPRVEIAVADRGPGVPARDRARVFRPFERVDDRLSRATEGSGIGLSLVRHVARAHGGDARVEETPGRGSTFVISIPRARSEA